MLDLSFGLPLTIRDAALKMVAPGPSSEINREYFAQNNEKAIEDGSAGTEEYEKTDEKARELLRRLATSKPYFRKGRAIEDPAAEGGSSSSGAGGGGGGGGNPAVGAGFGGPGPIRTRDSRAAAAAGAGPRGGGGRGGGGMGGRNNNNKRPFPSAAQLPPGPKDYEPPADKTIMSLFVTGVEDDLPEHRLRDFFKEHGKIKSLVCSHMSHCAFVNYETRDAAERAAAACKGRAVIAGCPLRVRWSQPRAVGLMNKDERSAMGRDGRSAFADRRRQQQQQGGRRAAIEGASGQGEAGGAAAQEQDLERLAAVAPPPGVGEVNYASLAGD